jgi:hypothetical protein
MIRSVKPNKPLWVKVIFEAPEYIYELLLLGTFPVYRKKIIDLFNKTLIYCQTQSRFFPGFLKWIELKTLLLLEWINNNWKKNIKS